MVLLAKLYVVPVQNGFAEPQEVPPGAGGGVGIEVTQPIAAVQPVPVTDPSDVNRIVIQPPNVE